MNDKTHMDLEYHGALQQSLQWIYAEHRDILNVDC